MIKLDVYKYKRFDLICVDLILGYYVFFKVICWFYIVYSLVLVFFLSCYVVLGKEGFFFESVVLGYRERERV